MKKFKSSIAILLTGLLMTFAGCGNGSDKTGSKDTSDYNASPAGPAPDNSNATNPSLGDTTLHRNDSLH